MRFVGVLSFPLLLLVAFVLFSGCSGSDNTPPQTQTPMPTTVITTTPTVSTHNLFSVGTIVRNPSGETSWIIMGYDADTDTYTRSPIYRNLNGKWGYRTDDRVTTTARATVEKLYPEIVGNVPPSEVAILSVSVEETVTATVETTIPELPVTVPEPVEITTHPTPSPTPTEDNSMVIVFIEPAFTFVGPSQEITVTGANFKPGSTAMLKSLTGRPDLRSRVTIFDNENRLRVLFDTPIGASGLYDFVVTAPDGSQGIKRGGFSIS